MHAQSQLVEFTKRQQKHLDSLESVLKRPLSDSIRVDIYNQIHRLTFIRKANVAIQYNDSIRQLAIKNKDSLLFHIADYNQGVLLHRRHKYSEALRYFDIVEAFCRRKGLSQRQSKINFYQGDCCFLSGNVDNAVEAFLRSLTISQRNGNYNDQLTTHIKLGKVYRATQYEKSLEHLNKAMELLSQVTFRGIRKRKGAILLQVGQTHQAYEEFERAIISYKLVQENMEGTLLDYQYHTAQSFLSDIYLKQGKLSLAMENAQEAMVFFDKKKANHYGMVRVRNNMGKIYQQQKAFVKAQQMYQEVLLIAEQNNMVYTKVGVKELQMHLAEETGDFEKSYALSREVSDMKDSILNKESNDKIHELTITYETEQKNTQIANLALEDRLKANKLRNQRTWIFGLLLGLSLLSFLLIKYNHKNVKIANQNEVIFGNLKEKEILLKEIHHRVKNNLQMVSSLLSLQTRSLKDSGAIEALAEGQSRVESMALIHQHLYKEDALTGVAVKDYIANLCKSVFSSHNISDNRVELNLELEDIHLDIESVVPIGLILNELITNACKYAFPGDRTGSLTIILNEVNDKLHLEVKDDGIGKNHVVGNEGFGSRLISTFAKKMDAKIIEKETTGYSIEFVISSYKKTK